MIATPEGEVAVEDVKEGQTVWSVDGKGQRVAVSVLAVSQTPVPPTHQVVDLALADGREVRVSAGHPTADGRTVGSLALGDPYDGSVVASVHLLPYPDGFTYDLLPESATGFYWADGILLGNTLTSP